MPSLNPVIRGAAMTCLQGFLRREASDQMRVVGRTRPGVQVRVVGELHPPRSPVVNVIYSGNPATLVSCSFESSSVLRSSEQECRVARELPAVGIWETGAAVRSRAWRTTFAAIGSR